MEIRKLKNIIAEILQTLLMGSLVTERKGIE
jgi:hypothetical protein